MRVEQSRPGVFTATLTAHELSVLLAGARMSLAVMSTDPQAGSQTAKKTLESVLEAFDASLEQDRARDFGGQASRDARPPNDGA